MATYDSIINVEEWISDHYLTTDETKGESYSKRVATRVKEWKDDEAEFGHDSPLTRFTSARQDLQKALATLDENTVDETATLIRQALGYGEPTRTTSHRAGSTTEFDAWTGTAGSALLLIAEPIETLENFATTAVRGEVFVDAKPSPLTAAALIGDLFLSDTPPDFIVTIAGGWVILAERESWPLGRYLAIDLALVVERNETKAKGEMQRVAVALARKNAERAADGVTWWAETIEESREHAVKVSGELRTAVRESIELIGNDILDRHREQGLPIDDIDGNELAKQSLRYLYRILFLLFAEASPELEILPTGTPEYDEGYGLSRLRELILTPPVTPNARSGTHLYESLQILFHLVDQGHDPQDSANPDFDQDAGEEGLEFRNLSADLFQPKATSIIDTVKLSNETLNTVLENLLLTREQSGTDRGFISYATLGVTELGQVYEGLMSYTGFIAEEDLFEVAKHSNPEKGSWVLPVAKADTVPQDSFVMQEKEVSGGVTQERRRHPRGSFVFRQSGRDRERSASFYTPQVLTDFTVSQAIEVLQETGRIGKADDVLSLTICEPAMGSGAFAVEAVRQLSELYATLRQEELGEQIPAENRTKELQKIKAHIALHQVYGVDLNATAVELAEISLWLDTMTADLKAPWFGLHLRCGNSLIGANRATYAPHQLKKKAWLTAVPERRPLTDVAKFVDSGADAPVFADGIHHFLLPSTGWGATADAKDVKDIAGEEQKRLKAWRRSITVTPTKKQTEQLKNLSRRVEKLWRFALIRMRIAEDQARRDIDLWGRESERSAQNITRRQIEADLFDNLNGSYNRLRLVMDAWTALWFWPLDQVPTEEHPERPELPDFDGWLEALTDVLGTDARIKAKDAEQYVLGWDADWEDLNAAETADWQFAGALNVEKAREKYPWLAVTHEVAKQQVFFHWDLDFASVFARGGFDLQVGNPPWVRPSINILELMADIDPWFQVSGNQPQSAIDQRFSEVSRKPVARRYLAQQVSQDFSQHQFLTSVELYPLQAGQLDLYKNFVMRCWINTSVQGSTGLIHPESIFTDKQATGIRREAYLRLRAHYQFSNALNLFAVDSKQIYGVNLYSEKCAEPRFTLATNLYHPQTALHSRNHDGTGPTPGMKDANGKWDVRPHRNRIVKVDQQILKSWARILEDDDSVKVWQSVRMLFPTSVETASVLEKMAYSDRVSSLGLQYSTGWHSGEAKKQYLFRPSTNRPVDIKATLPAARQITPSNAMFQEFELDTGQWVEIDLENLPSNFLPTSADSPSTVEGNGDTGYPLWEVGGYVQSSSRFFRIAWSIMVKLSNSRSLTAAIIPPGVRHTDNIVSGGPLASMEDLVAAAFSSSYIADFYVRSQGLTNIYADVFSRLPLGRPNALWPTAAQLSLQLNCLTQDYSDLWQAITSTSWDTRSPLRVFADRSNAQSEIDAIYSLTIGLSSEEMLSIYRTQFPALYKKDGEIMIDANGRVVANDVMKLQKKLKDGEELTEEQRTWTHPQSEVTYVFEYPFTPLDREADLRAAYAKYEKLVQGA